MAGTHTTFDPLLGGRAADRMLELCRGFSRGDAVGYGMYSNEGFDTGYAPGLAQRIDTIINYLRDHADSGLDTSTLAARTNYFRETYAYGEEIVAPGIEDFFRHDRLRASAAQLYDGRPVIEPAIVYANILVPGQVLTVHTDVPEFRGANRKVAPQWLLVVMHHSGLFERWRMPIATAITYFGDDEGGALRFYPDGAGSPPSYFPTEHDTGILLDADSIFHAVELVTGAGEDQVGRLRPGMRLAFDGDGGWVVRDPSSGDDIARYADGDVRFSVSWKAYCFADDDERDAWRAHGDDLSLEVVLERLEADARERGALDGPRPDPETFGKLLIETYIAFPRRP